MEMGEPRRRFSGLGWTLVIYMILMNITVGIVVFADTMMQTIRVILENGGQISVGQTNEIASSVANNAWGYMLAIAIGGVAVLLWKGKDFCCHEIWKKGRPMDASSFFMLLCLFFGVQFVVQILAVVLEFILQFFGLSVMDSLNAASANASTVSMFLYMGIAAPITEEILFRGVIQRTMMPFGKRFAIVMSAFLFGIFHGNLVQTPYAFLVGLVLGYVAAEHSIFWAILLHMLNNLGFGILLEKALSFLPEDVSGGAITLIMLAFFIGAVIILIVRRREISDYVRQDPMQPEMVRIFFKAPGVIVLMVLMTLSMLLMLFLPLIQ